MSKSRSSMLAWVALGASAVFAAGSAAHYFSRRSSPAPARVASPAPSPPAASTAEAATAEGRATLRLASLLSSLRRPGVSKEEAESIEREARELSARLGEDLRRNPGSWSEVVELATSAEDLKVALRLASTLGEGEALWIERLAGPVRRRHVAATALAGGTSSAGLQALVGVADRDGDAGVRLAAITSLAQRRLRAAPEGAGAIEQALRRRAESDADAHVREVARNLLTPAPPPGLRPPPPKKK